MPSESPWHKLIEDFIVLCNEKNIIVKKMFLPEDYRPKFIGLDLTQKETAQSLLDKVFALTLPTTTIKHIKLCLYVASTTTDDLTTMKFFKARFVFLTSVHADGVCECCKAGFEK